MKVTIILVVLTLWTSMASARPGHIFYSFPAASSQTTVLRDALGNQATAYAYQDGHSSSVAVSRNDVSKHLAYVPVAPAPVVYEEPYVAAAPYYSAPYHHPASYYGSYYY